MSEEAIAKALLILNYVALSFASFMLGRIYQGKKDEKFFEEFEKLITKPTLKHLKEQRKKILKEK